MFKVGIIGCGGIGMTHARSWKSIDEVDVAAVMDIDKAKAEKAAESLGSKYYVSISDMPHDLDAVSIATPPKAHYKCVYESLGRGYNVLCEKPFTLTADDGIKLNEIAKEKKLVLSVGFKMRFEPVFIEAKKYIGNIGKLVAITTNKLQKFNPRPDGEWVKSTGVMRELSIHDFDLISFITGKYPARVLYSKLEHRFGWEKEDAFSIVADYDDGVTAQLQGMYAVSSTFCFRDLTITFLGDMGYMRIERPDRIIMHTEEYKVINVEPVQKSSFVLELEHFMRCVQGTDKNMLTADDAIHMNKFIMEVEKKSKFNTKEAVCI